MGRESIPKATHCEYIMNWKMKLDDARTRYIITTLRQNSVPNSDYLGRKVARDTVTRILQATLHMEPLEIIEWIETFEKEAI